MKDAISTSNTLDVERRGVCVSTRISAWRTTPASTPVFHSPPLAPASAGHAVRRRGESGLTLLELVTVLAIIGILLAIAVPRYLGSRRNALIAEANHTLQEVKSLAWAYYQQHESWEGIDTSNFQARLGFTPTPSSCWAYSIEDATDSQIQVKATGVASPVRCAPALGVTVTLTLNSDGSSQRTQAFP